jgi:M6 family metalloprotease-like protein
VIAALLLAAALPFLVPQAFAVPAYPGPVELEQPDGAKVVIHLRGDEFFAWHEDADGYVVQRDERDGAWKYARPRPDAAAFEVIEDAVVGVADPAALKLEKRALPRPSLIREQRERRRPELPGTRPAGEAEPGLTPAADGTGDDASPAPPPPARIPVSGTKTVKNIVILAAFNDHWDSGNSTVLSAKGRTNTTEYSNLFNQIGHTTDTAVGSVKDYYLENSYGKLTVDSVVTAWVRLPQNESYYGGNDINGRDLNPKQMVLDAINAADAAGFDFSQGDSDGDGWVDCLTVIHSGHGEEYTGNSANCIWSHKWSLSSVTTVDGVKMSIYHTEPALRGSDGTIGAASTSIIRIGVICHEMGHFFGLPDLYDTSGGPYSTISVGNWCVMSGGSWGGGDGKRPCHFSAWCKQSLGFVAPQLIHSQSSVSFPDVKASDTVYMLRNGSFNQEYFLVENRNQTGFDASTPGKGIMIWHIDAKSNSNGSTYDVHPIVKMEDADGNTTANQTTSAWYSGNASMLAGGFRDQTGNSNTNAMRYQSGSYVTRTNNSADYSYIRLSNFSATGVTMTCDVSTLIPTVGSQSVATANYTVSWAASSDASKYEIQEGQETTATSFTEGFEDEDVLNDNWILAGCKRSSANSRTGTYSLLLSIYDGSKLWNSVQSLRSRQSFKLTASTTAQFYYMCQLTAGNGKLLFQSSNDNGVTWQTLWSHSGGQVSSWTAANVSTANFTSAGFSVGDDLLCMFVMDTEYGHGWNSYPNYGWAIDDFAVSNTSVTDYTGWATLNNNVATASYGITGKANGTYAYRVRGYTNSTWQRWSPAATVVVNIPGGSPEIDLQGNGQSIASGSVVPSLADHTDFGSAAVAGDTVTRTYTILNTGTATLNLTGIPPVSLLGPDSGDFAVAVQPTAAVAASGLTTFQVTFDPSVAGVRNAIVTIANDDADENPYTFAIQGTGTVPEIDVQGNGVSIANNDLAPDAADDTDFGPAVIGEAAVSTTFTIVNTGIATLNLSGTPRVALGGPDAAEFAVTLQPSATVAASGGTTTFTVAFAPTILGMRNATVSIANDDADENPYLFAIQGTGSLPSYEILFLALPGGTVEGAARVTQTVVEGEDCAPVTAIPDASYEFAGWSGDAVGADATITVTNVTAAMTIFAYFAPAEKVACGLLFPVPVDEIADTFPALAEFTKSPKSWGQYHDRFKDPFAIGKPKKAAAKVAKIAKGTTATSVDAEWRKKLRLYNVKAFKAGQKGGTGAVAWLAANPVRDLPVTLFASGKEPAVGVYLDELRPVALAGPILDAVRDVTDTVDIADASELPPGGRVLLQGRWFGVKPPKAWLEYRDAADAVKCLKLKAVKPYAFGAYGKLGVSVMNPADGTSALVLQLPEVLPPGIVAIVIDNGVGLAARTLAVP